MPLIETFFRRHFLLKLAIAHKWNKCKTFQQNTFVTLENALKVVSEKASSTWATATQHRPVKKVKKEGNVKVCLAHPTLEGKRTEINFCANFNGLFGKCFRKCFRKRKLPLFC